MPPPCRVSPALFAVVAALAAIVVAALTATAYQLVRRSAPDPIHIPLVNAQRPLSAVWIAVGPDDEPIGWYCSLCDSLRSASDPIEYLQDADTQYAGSNPLLWNFNDPTCPHMRRREILCRGAFRQASRGCSHRLSFTEFTAQFPTAKIPDFFDPDEGAAWHLRSENTLQNPEERAAYLAAVTMHRVGLLDVAAWGRSEESYRREALEGAIRLHSHTRVAEGGAKMPAGRHHTVFLVDAALAESRSGIDLEHDGNALYFEGTCRECGQEHFSWMSGD